MILDRVRNYLSYSVEICCQTVCNDRESNKSMSFDFQNNISRSCLVLV